MSESVTLRDLLADPTYRQYFLRAPALPQGARTPMPWRVWGIRHDKRWAGKTFETYTDAFALVKKMLKDRDTYADAVLTCRPIAFRPPAGIEIPAGQDWCGHCRRPSVFRRRHNHVAMKKWPVISNDDVRRCAFCAARGPEKVFHW